MNFTISFLRGFRKQIILKCIQHSLKDSFRPRKFSKIFKHMTAISKNVYFNISDDIVNKYNKTGDRTIKMKPIDVTSDSYGEYNEDSNKNGCKFKVGDRVKISTCRKTFAKRYTQNWSEKAFIVSKMINQLMEVFMKKNCKKQISKNSE